MDTKEPVTYKLANVEGRSLAEIREGLERGAKFVVFQTHLGLLVASFQWISRAYFVADDESARHKGFLYSIPTMLLGWWSISYGLPSTIGALRNNLRGGLDVTADIADLLDEESLEHQEVIFTRIHTLFDHVARHNVVAIVRAIAPCLSMHSAVRNAYVGLFVNTEEYENPFFVIGIDVDSGIEDIEQELRKALRKPFSKTVRFEFIDPRAEVWSRLVEQGEQVYGDGAAPEWLLR